MAAEGTAVVALENAMRIWHRQTRIMISTKKSWQAHKKASKENIGYKTGYFAVLGSLGKQGIKKVKKRRKNKVSQ